MKSFKATMAQLLLLLCLVTLSLAKSNTKETGGIKKHSDVVVIDTSVNHDASQITIESALSATNLDHLKSIITKYGTLTSCKQFAYTSLYHSCTDFEKNHTSATSANASPTAKFNIDEIETIHAARLTLCELSEVTSIKIPATCQALAVDGAKTTLEHISKVDLGLCLNELHNDNRSWASYINSKQNIYTICKSARTDLEKEAFITMLKEAVEAANKGKSFFASINQVISFTDSNINKLLEKTQTLAKGLTNLYIDLDVVRVYLKDEMTSLFDKFSSIMNQYDAAASTAYNNAQKQQESSLMVAKTVNTGMEAYQSDIRGAQQALANLEISVLNVHQSMLLISEEQQVMHSRLINASMQMLESSEKVSTILTQLGATLTFFDDAVKRLYSLLTSPYLVVATAIWLIACFAAFCFVKLTGIRILPSFSANRPVVVAGEKV